MLLLQCARNLAVYLPLREEESLCLIRMRTPCTSIISQTTTMAKETKDTTILASPSTALWESTVLLRFASNRKLIVHLCPFVVTVAATQHRIGDLKIFRFARLSMILTWGTIATIGHHLKKVFWTPLCLTSQVFVLDSLKKVRLWVTLAAPISKVIPRTNRARLVTRASNQTR